MNELKKKFEMTPNNKILSHQFNKIDKIITQAHLKAEKKTTNLIYPFPWSPKLIILERKIRFIRRLLTTTPFYISPSKAKNVKNTILILR